MDKFYAEYKHYIESQMTGYKLSLEVINYIIEELKRRGKIQGAELHARVKSYLSVKRTEEKNKRAEQENATITNESEKKKLKKIDDCFGIRIIANEEDLNTIIVVIRELFKEKQLKVKNEKDRNYKAIHQMGLLDLGKIDRGLNPKGIHRHHTIPLIEMQYWDKELAKRCLYGEQNYGKYKSDVPVLQSGEHVESLYHIPIAYESVNGKIRRIPAEEEIQRMYPTFDDENRE